MEECIFRTKKVNMYLENTNMTFDSQSHAYSILKSLGLPTSEQFKTFSTRKDVEKFIEYFYP